MYNYKATCTRVIDGDTIEVIIDLGFNVMIKETVRLKGIDTPESRTRNTLEKQAGLKVEQFLIDLIEGKTIYITTEKSNEKYGRYLADIYLNFEDTKSINELLIEKEYAKVYNGEAKMVWTIDALNRIITG
jgi:micrococcal nuclease